EPGSFSESLLRRLTDQVAAGGGDDVHAVDESTNTLHYMRAIRLTNDCLICHGKPGSADDRLQTGRDALGFAMEGWKEGEMHGAYHVTMPLDQLDASVAGFVKYGLSWTVPTGLAGAGLLIWLMRRILTCPMAALVARFQDIADGEGDLTQRVEADRNDELGQLGR